MPSPIGEVEKKPDVWNLHGHKVIYTFYAPMNVPQRVLIPHGDL